MHKVGTLAGLVLAFVVYAIGALRGNSFLSLLSRAGIAFASAYFMVLFFGLVVVFSSSSPKQEPPAPEPKPKDKKKQQRPAGQPDSFSIPEN